MGERIAAMKLSSCLVVALCLGAAFGEVYFEESFGDGWESRWVTAGKEGLGEFKASAGKFGDDVGLQTSEDAKFYGISAALPTFSNKDKTLIVQYTVKHEQNIDCGGAYLKLGPAPFDGKEFNGDTEYNIMFGPDICGMTKRTHLIFNYNKENLLKTKDLCTESNELTHLYTLTVKPDNTFDVSIDGVSVEAGSLAEGWKFLKEKEVDDPEDKSQRTGSMRPRWMTQRTPSQRAMTTSLPRRSLTTRRLRRMPPLPRRPRRSPPRPPRSLPPRPPPRRP